MTGNKGEEKILRALGKVDEQYILEADPSEKRKVSNGWMKWGTLAACICLIFSGILAGQGAYRDYMKETSYISIDVNPSLEFCLNSQHKVIDVCAYNEDGQRVVDCLNVKNMSYEDAIKTLLENETFCSYLKEDSELTFTVVSDEEEEIIKGIEEYTAHCEVNQEIYCADYETRHEAVENHCSTGKYRAYQELAEYDEDVTLEECKNMTMHELHERIRECENHGHGVGNENGNSAGQSGISSGDKVLDGDTTNGEDSNSSGNNCQGNSNGGHGHEWNHH